jgi:hypothetical protein
VSTTPEPTLRELYATPRACDAVAEAHGFVVHPLVTPADVPDRGLPPRLYANVSSGALLFWVVGYPARRQLRFGDTATTGGAAWGAGDASALDALLEAHDAEAPDLRSRALRDEAGRRFYQWRWRLARARAADRGAGGTAVDGGAPPIRADEVPTQGID